MAARITNFPAYVVFDRTYQGTFSTTISNTATTPVNNAVGTLTNVIDRDLTTYYEMNSTGSSGDGVITYSVNYDANKILWNVQVAIKYHRVQGDTSAFEYSLNGTDWVALRSDEGSATDAYAYTIPSMRYLRAWASKAAGSVQLRVYELAVMGSS